MAPFGPSAVPFQFPEMSAADATNANRAMSVSNSFMCFTVFDSTSGFKRYRNASRSHSIRTGFSSTTLTISNRVFSHSTDTRRA